MKKIKKQDFCTQDPTARKLVVNPVKLEKILRKLQEEIEEQEDDISGLKKKIK